MLEAVGTRRAGRFAITTRHRFAPSTIGERWAVRRLGGHGWYSVTVQLPTWGAATTPVAVLRDGTPVPLAVGAAAIRLGTVRELRLSGYTVVLRRPHARDGARRPDRARAREPGPRPDARADAASGKRFERAGLAARIVP